MADPGEKANEQPATEEELAVVLSDDVETQEEAFEAAFDEFAATDDTAAPPQEGREEGHKAGAEASAETTEDEPASGEQPPDTEEAAPDSAATMAFP